MSTYYFHNQDRNSGMAGAAAVVLNLQDHSPSNRGKSVRRVTHENTFCTSQTEDMKFILASPTTAIPEILPCSFGLLYREHASSKDKIHQYLGSKDFHNLAKPHRQAPPLLYVNAGIPNTMTSTAN